MILSVNCLFDKWRHPSIISALECGWVLKEIHLFVNFLLYDLSFIVLNFPVKKCLRELLVGNFSSGQQAINVFSLLLFHLFSLLGWKSLHEVHIVLKELVMLIVVFSLVVYSLNTIFLIFLIISIFIGHIFLTEVIIIRYFSVQSVSHHKVFGIVHHILFILCDVIEVLSSLHLHGSHLGPVFALDHFVNCLARNFAIVLKDASFDVETGTLIVVVVSLVPPVLSHEPVVEGGGDEIFELGLLSGVVVIFGEELLVLWEGEVGT